MVLNEQLSKYVLKSTNTIQEDETVGYLITEMSRNRFRRFPVLNEDNQPVGMVTSSDIIGALQELGDSSFLKLKISEIMSDRIVVISHDKTIRDTIDLMYNIGISGLPVVEDNKIKGIITEKDLLLIDKLWKEIKDIPISEIEGPGRPITQETIVNSEYTFWQIADKLVNLAQRQILVQDAEGGGYLGIVTHMTLLNSLVNTITITSPDFNALQNLAPSDMTLKPMFQRGIPMMVSSARLWMNSRGIEAFPLFSRGKPVKLITEKDLIGYLANSI